MSLLRNISLIAALLLPLSPAVAQAPAQATSEFTNYRLSDSAGAAVTVTGTVTANFNNEILLLQSGPETLVVKLAQSFWDDGYRPGDVLSVAGTIDTTPVEQNALVATGIQILQRPRTATPPLGLETASTARLAKVGQPVALIARVEGVRDQEITLIDATGSISFDRGPRARNLTTPLSDSTVYAAIGVVEERYNGKYLRGVSLLPVTNYFREGATVKTQKIEDILDSSPVGQTVRARGNVVYYTGERELPILVDGEDVLVIYLAPQQKALDLRIGSRSEAIGIFDTEEIRGKTYGVLHNARVVPADRRPTRIAGVTIPGI